MPITRERLVALMDKDVKGTLTEAERIELRAEQSPERFDDEAFELVDRDPPTTLNTDEQSKLLVDVMLRRDPSIEGPEAERFYAKLAREHAALAAQGIEVAIPSELPDPDA